MIFAGQCHLNTDVDQWSSQHPLPVLLTHNCLHMKWAKVGVEQCPVCHSLSQDQKLFNATLKERCNFYLKIHEKVGCRATGKERKGGTKRGTVGDLCPT